MEPTGFPSLGYVIFPFSLILFLLAPALSVACRLPGVISDQDAPGWLQFQGFLGLGKKIPKGKT